MSRNNPCFTCRGGVDCTECLNSPQNSTPVRLYTPRGAARALLVGKVLHGAGGRTYYFGKMGIFTTFWCREKEGGESAAVDLSGLWEEI